MIVMEGLMLVPPDRGTIIGRAIWKPRYVVLGTGAQLKTQNDILSQSESQKGSSRKGLKSTSSKPSLVDVTQHQADQGLYLSVYKAKGDWEFIAQYPVSAFKSCEIRYVQHRKQSPSLPTMLLDFKPDTPTERQQKRRSSRTAGLASKDPWAGTLLFRTIAEERYNIYDWQLTIKPQLTAESQESLESLDELQNTMSPTSPAFISFSNPFASRETRTPSGTGSRPDLQHRSSSNQTTSTYPHAPRDRPSAMISPSPSLRSRRSDLSSQGSSLQPPLGFTSSHPIKYNAGLPSDLPSPASTAGYDTQFIEGWTSAQGRSSALSSHTRGSNSIASAVAAAAPPIGSTPPGPRETILDRAFQMRYIPGSEHMQGEEKLSSIARFEALMQEADERKRQMSTASSQGGFASGSGWDLDEESEESSSGELENDDEEPDVLEMSDQEVVIPTPAQRALDYISGRRTPISSSRPLSPAPKSPPIPFLNPQAMSAFHGHYSNGGGLRPRTGNSSSKRNSRPSSLALPSRSVSAATVPTLKNSSSSSSSNGNLKTGDRDAKDLKRRSSTSAKRLSFTEFAKRLSSTSSLLLVQTNASSSSGRDSSRRTSSEFGADEERNPRPNSVSMRGGAASNGIERDARDKRCGWRGSVGVFGSEGGFL